MAKRGVRDLKFKLPVGAINGATFTLHEYGINVKSREIFLHPYINVEFTEAEDPGVEYRMTAQFIKNMSLLNNQGNGNILIHQQTEGGCYDLGMAIYDTIKARAAPVTMLAYAYSRSMSSITIQAAARRVLMPHTFFMIHYGIVAADDTTRGFLSYAATVKQDNATMIEVYVDRCIKGKAFKGKTREQIIRVIEKRIREKQEWYMTAQEAVDHGFVDGIFGTRGFKTLAEIRR